MCDTQLEYLKSGFNCKKERYKKNFATLEFDFFSSSAQVCFKNTIVISVIIIMSSFYPMLTPSMEVAIITPFLCV